MTLGKSLSEDLVDERLALALSGGGFRASFFHIGVLARLAELDMLRRVEVLSTVSGGSIVGTLYYLHVKNLLECKPDAAITRDDYVEIVQAIEEDFQWAAQRNIRARIFSDLRRNFAMCKPSYSRTSRVGQQLEEFFYKPAWKGDLGPKGRIRLRDLLITPADEPAGFRPDIANKARSAKVPILMLNATTLNTGRNWRFEAIRMGESLPADAAQAAIARDLNPAYRFAPGYFYPRDGRAALDGRARDFPLGLAVAASAAVPGLFHPVAIKKLYDLRDGAGKKILVSVELVDGGVHDNQGIQGLFDRDCTPLIISDASGQYTPLHRPGSEIPAVIKRTLNLYGARLRQEQLVRGRQDDHRRPIALVHLRRGIDARDIDPSSVQHELTNDKPTEFGINTQVQEWLSKLRTDLDNFGDVEAGALMLDGYKMIDKELDARPAFGTRANSPQSLDVGTWHFGALDPMLNCTSCHPRVVRRLTVGTERFVKPLRFYPWMRAVVSAVSFAVFVAVGFSLVLLGYFLDSVWNTLSTPQWPAWIVVLVGGGTAFIGVSYALQKPKQPARFIVSHVLPVLLAPLLWLMAGSQLLFNSWYLKAASYKSVGLEEPSESVLNRVRAFSQRDRPYSRF